MSIRFFSDDLKYACGTNSLATKLKWLMFSHTIHMVFLIRLGQSCIKLPFLGGFLRWFIEYFIRIIFSSDISLKSKIGKGLMIMHGHDIVIGADVIIGENCKIFNGVTLGNKNTNLASSGNQPKIGNRVMLSTGAKVLGSILIEDDCIIGANAVVVKGCSRGGTYVGIPAMRIEYKCQD